jgi:hypothetical protein
MLKAGGVEVVALCDVDAGFASHIETMEYGNRHITGLYRQFPDVPKYKDFRVMLNQEQDNIDAVVITTPEGFAALFNGKDFAGWRVRPKAKEEPRTSPAARRCQEDRRKKGNQDHVQ